MKDLLQRFNGSLARFTAYAPLPIRLLLGGHLVYGVQDNVLSYVRMLEFRDFLLQNGFPVPLLSAHLSVYAQLLAGLCCLAGAFTRAAAGLMIVNFLVALGGCIWAVRTRRLFRPWSCSAGRFSCFCTGRAGPRWTGLESSRGPW